MKMKVGFCLWRADDAELNQEIKCEQDTNEVLSTHSEDNFKHFFSPFADPKIWTTQAG